MEYFVGQELIMKSNITAHPEALYDCEVVAITPHCIIVDTFVRQEQMHEPKISDQKVPVRYGIKKVDIGRGTKLMYK